MNKLERVRNALSGRPVDRPPFSVWYHFGLQHAPAELTAKAHLGFLAAYGLDWLKVMNDYSYPMPEGVETVSSAADLAKLAPFDVEAAPPGEQLKVIDILLADLQGQALVVDTVFNAWNTLKRSVVKDRMDDLMRDHAEALETALGVVNENLIRYAQASLARGAAGIFLAVPASADALTREQYERFMRPYDLAFLEAIQGRGEFHVLHAHGRKLYFDRLLDYPVHAISWGDRDGGPSLEEARHMTGLALLGGLQHEQFAYQSAAAVRDQVQAAIHEAAGHRFLLSPGCSIPTYTFPELIHAAKDEVERAAPPG